MDIHSEAFEQLLGDALRSGPGTPQWKQAVEVLREAGSEGEEYAMLCRAREDLESGREYRSVRAGSGFTRKLMDRLDHERGPQWSVPTASIMVYIAIAVIVAGVSLIGWQMVAPSHHSWTLADVQDAFCVTPVVDARFENAMPEGFGRLGRLPVDVRGGLVPEVQPRETRDPLGGGVYFTQSMPADSIYAVEMSVAVTNPKSELITQMFVADEGTFSADKGISQRELVCLIAENQVRVILPDGKMAGETPLVLDSAGNATVRMKLAGDMAMVEHGGKTIWSGGYHMDHAARYVGLRYLTRGGDSSTGVAIRSLRVMKP